MASPVIVSRIQNRRGTQAQFDGLIYNPAGPNSMYPSGYNGVGGYGSFPDFTSANYPNVLLPGEIGFVTDTSNMYIGNTNGRYTKIQSSGTISPGVELLPAVFSLAPTQSGSAAPVFATITGLTFVATPFFSMLYDVTDSGSLDWNALGTSFSKNGEVTVSCVSGGPATLTDTANEINTSSTFFSLIAVYNAPYIEIQYSHNHPTNLTFSTSTVHWVPF